MGRLYLAAYASLISAMEAGLLKDERVTTKPRQRGTPDRNPNLKEFHINGKTVWAINEKNAIKKANKI
jgi:hypothetical protein